MAQPRRGLTGIAASAEPLVLEQRGDQTVIGRIARAETHTRLAHARYEFAVAAIGFAARRNRRDPQRVVPVRIDALEVIDEIGLHETVYIHAQVANLDAVIGIVGNRGRQAEYAQPGQDGGSNCG